ncbi:hypothetical protein AVEN_27218-1 [Araneus ventricosus]|uniref:Uncharacterized protein n=1 Tax=Araneus ventricosus TaxID=182803 RepID=A0A4Y2CB76_ARAVE|nr:hypothetical protein AVEN_27218-1 [Araneus ventricosus]
MRRGKYTPPVPGVGEDFRTELSGTGSVGLDLTVEVSDLLGVRCLRLQFVCYRGLGWLRLFLAVVKAQGSGWSQTPLQTSSHSGMNFANFLDTKGSRCMRYL